MEFREMGWKPARKITREFMADYEKRINRGKYSARHFVTLSGWSSASILDWKIPTGLDWPFDLLVESRGHEGFKDLMAWYVNVTSDVERMSKFPEHRESAFALGISSNSDLFAMWAHMRALELSDTHNWYTLNEDVTLALMATELRCASAEDVRMPYRSFHVEIPRGIIRLRSSLSGVHDVMSMSISIAYRPKEPPELSILHAGSFMRQVVPDNRLQGDVIILNYYLEPLPMVKGGDGVISTFLLFPLRCINEVFTSTHFESPTKATESCFLFGKEVEGTLFDKTMANFVFSLLLYLNQPEVDMVKKRESSKPKAKSRAGRVTKLVTGNTWLVGTRVKLSREVKDSIRGGTRSRHSHSSVVRGHYRRYRKGPRDDWAYELYWIAPHVRKGDGPILGHTYKM